KPGVRQRAEEGDAAADDPYEQRDAEVAVRLFQHHARHDEDARADHRAEREQQQVGESKRPPQIPRGVVGGTRHTATSVSPPRTISERTVSDSIISTSTSTPSPGRSRGTATIPFASIVHSGVTTSRAQ